MEIPKFITDNPALAAAAAAGLYGLFNKDSKVGKFLGMSSNQRPVGYSEGIPEYGVSRALLPNAFATTTPTGAPRVPGSGGRRYFSDMTYTPTGNTMSAAINPVNVPVTTRPRAGVLDTLSAEEAQFLLEKLFSGQGISRLGDDTEGKFAQGGLTSLPQSQGITWAEPLTVWQTKSLRTSTGNKKLRSVTVSL